MYRSLFNSVLASPVTIVASVVIIACASVLVVKVSSNIEATTDSESFSESVKKSSAISSSSNVTIKPNHTRIRSAVKNQPSTNKPLGSEPDVGSESGYQQQNISSGNGREALKRNYTNINRNSGQNNYSNSEQHSVKEIEGLPSTSENPAFKSHNGPSVFNYSNTSTSTGNATNTDTSGSASSSSATTTSIDSATTSNADTLISDNNPPASLENEVKIDQDETHYISCVPIEAGGPPCMCTYTVEDLDGSTSRVEDNCG